MAVGEIQSRVVVLADPQAVAQRAAETVIRLAKESQGARQRFLLVLAGGTAPRLTYQLLGSDEHRARVNWQRTDVFWGDERYVAPSDSQSNFRMAREALLQNVPLPPGNIHRVPTEVSPADAAALQYEQEIRRVTGVEADWPRFDLVLLGLGTNGHTASLFPQSAVLREQKRLVVADFVAEVNAWRITMTAPLLNHARNILFIATGAEKASVLREVLAGPADPERLPAQLIRPAAGTLTWLIDKPAAAQLPAAMVTREINQ